MVTRRLFIGIPLTPALQKRLGRESEAWENLPLIVTRRENLHVTLLFLGFVNEENILGITRAIGQAGETIPPFEMKFDGITLAPDAQNPTMVWLSGKPVEELRRLREALEHNLGYRVPERKSFRPHVTLAKIRRGRWNTLSEKPVLEKKLELVETVDAVTLYESRNEDGKRIYQPLEEFPLGGSPE